MNNIKQANINITLKGMFRQWLEITKPFHKLAKQQQDVLALLLYYHYMFKKDITTEKVLWKMVFDYDTKAKIKEELGIKDAVLHNNLTILRKKNIIINNQIVSTYIPKLTDNAKNFKVIFNFNLVNEK
jgi:hypothetical protein